MHELAPLIYDLALMLGMAGIVALLFQRIRQPIVLGYLVAGVVIGPYTPPHNLVSDIPNIQILSELGVIFLMFALGLEFSFQKLTRVGFSASITGFIEVVLMVAVGYATGILLGWSYYDSLFLGAGLAISSTTIIIKAIDELKLKTKRFAELIFGVLIVEDLFAILLLVALSTVVLTKNVFSMEMVDAAVKLVIVVGSWFIIGYFLVPPLFRRIADYISQETLTIISVALCLALVCVAAYFHYSAALGAFIMGSILAETVLVRRIEELIYPIRDIFAAVFFISVGMLIDPKVIAQYWDVVLIISLVTIFGKIIITSMGSLLTGQSLKTSVRVGFGMAQIGEFSFIIAALGVSLNVTSSKLYPIIVAVSCITTFTTPYLIRLSGYIATTLDEKLPARFKYFLASYSSWVYRTQTSAQQNPFFGKVSIKLFTNAVIVAIIFTFVDVVIYPRIESFQYSLWTSETLCLFIALFLSSPFIWGMLFSFKAMRMPDYAKIYLNPAVFIIWLVTLTEIAVLSISYFQSLFTILFLFITAAIFFVFSFQHLEKSYHWFESQLMNNIKHKSDGHTRYSELAPWDTHLVEINVGDHSPVVGKTLGQIRVRELFGINIVAIMHGSRVIPAPRGTEMIVEHDKLIVLGNDDQIEAFTAFVEKGTKNKVEVTAFLDNFDLRAVLLKEDHPLVGKTIRDSKIRETVSGMIVGIERDNERILNPEPQTVLRVDDLLLIVGLANKVDSLE